LSQPPAGRSRAGAIRIGLAVAMGAVGCLSVAMVLLVAVTRPDCGIDYAGPCHRLGYALLLVGGVALEVVLAGALGISLAVAWARQGRRD
jgi:hypothetical protein